MTFYTTVTRGALSNTWTKAVNSFEGERVEVTIKKATKRRSDPQNKYFHGCVIPIITNALNELGHRTNNDDTKEMLKRQFLTEDVHLKDGLLMQRTRKTSELTTTEFLEFVADVQQFASEYLETYVPDPNEELKLDL